MQIIKIKNLDHVYAQGSPFEKKALSDINLSIEEGEFIGLIGHTGSGKSTLVSHLNGLLKPTSGSIIVDGEDITNEKNLRHIRQKVGLVFQYPEYQLFEETIGADVAFGPKNLGLEDEEIKRRVKNSMESVGLSYEDYKDKSPFEISGGQKRRVAIAGVLAMEPKVLILDEPTAGLDPHGRDEILSNIVDIYKKGNITIIIVSHSMEDMANIAKRLIVMNKGKVIMDDSPREVFKREEELIDIGLGVPQITSFMRKLESKGLNINSDCITVEEAKEEVEKYLRGKKC